MTDRYATNAFTNFADFEKGVFSAGQEQTVRAGDNPDFIWPPKQLRNAPTGNTQKVQRGYMRMLSQGFSDGKNLSKRRLHFQFNPDNIVRAVTARNDIQLWMNQDPVQLTQAIPGDANFAFELLFNREAEVVSGMYKSGSTLVPSQEKANLPLGNAGDSSVKSSFVSGSSVTDIGVLADLIVFDEIIGQGVNTQLIESVLKNTQKVTNAKRTSAINAAKGNTPSSTASAIVTEVVGGKITKVEIQGGGSGYTGTPPIIVLTGGGGDGTGDLTATIKDGKVEKIVVPEGGTGSGYTDAKKGEINLKFVGGGGGTNSTSANTTSDTQDQAPAQFDMTSAQQAMYANYGNSAFLVSLPVRIVFSSLFMVEGYITATQVTFNKFNANMVPTQCMVGVTMQAMYIGFAREKTYLTTNLETALATADTGGEGTTSLADQQVTATYNALGEKLFNRITAGYTGLKQGDANVSPEAIMGNDRKKTIALEFWSTPELIAALAGTARINEITQLVTISHTYRGNTATAPAGKDHWASGETFTTTGSAKFNTGDLNNTKRDAHDTMIIQMNFQNSETLDYPLDDSSTALWDTDVTIRFGVTTANGISISAAQKVHGAQYKKGWNTDIYIHDFCVLSVDRINTNVPHGAIP